MLKYILKRLLLFIPILFIISIAAFLINKVAPGDPVERNVQNITGAGNKSLNQQRVVQKKFWRKKLGLDLPIFYFGIRTLADPDSLYKIYPPGEKEMLQRLLSIYGNWNEISRYYRSLKNLEHLISRYENHKHQGIDTLSNYNEYITHSKFECRSVCNFYSDIIVSQKLNSIIDLIPDAVFFYELKNEAKIVKRNHEEIISNASVWKNYFPVISFHLMNQYHRWIFGDGNWITGKGSVFSKGIIRGDFGTSYITGLPVTEEIKPKLFYSLSLALISIIISYMISAPIGIYSAGKENKLFDKISGYIMFLLYSLPLFWFATVLLLLFANPDVLQLFPASGIMPVTGFPSGSSLTNRIWLTIPYLVLPIICYCYAPIAFISSSLRVSMIGELNEQYIKTARAKGLNEGKILLNHAFRNSLLPLITVFANVLPVSMGGSLIIESIFSIPGMGLEAVNAIHHQNYPVIIAIFVITGFFTLTAYLISDLLYALADPRISFNRKIT